METIRSNDEISAVFDVGKRFSNPYFTLIVNGREESSELYSSERGREGRVAFIAGKRNGGAVWRNSAKRRMREICRELGGPWKDHDVLFVAKKRIMNASFNEVSKAAEDCVLKAKFR